jgi:hypothetical protein
VSFTLGDRTIQLPANLLTNSPSTLRTAILIEDTTALTAAVGVVEKEACIGSFDLLMGAIIYGKIDRLEVRGPSSGQRKYLAGHYANSESSAYTTFDFSHLLLAIFLAEQIQAPYARYILCQEVSDDYNNALLTKEQLVKCADRIGFFKRNFPEACRSLTDFLVSWTISFGSSQPKDRDVLDLHDASVKAALDFREYRAIIREALDAESVNIDDAEETRMRQFLSDCLSARPEERTRKNEGNYGGVKESKLGTGKTKPSTRSPTELPIPAEDGVAAENTAATNNVAVPKNTAKVPKTVSAASKAAAAATSTSAPRPTPSALPTTTPASGQTAAPAPTRRSARLANQDRGPAAWASLIPKRKQAPDAQAEDGAEDGPANATKKQAAPSRKRRKVTPKTNTKATAPAKDAPSTTEPSTAHVPAGQTAVKSTDAPEGVKSGAPLPADQPAAPKAGPKSKAKPKPKSKSKGKARGKPTKANEPRLAAKAPRAEHIAKAKAIQEEEEANAQSTVAADPQDDAAGAEADDPDADASDGEDPYPPTGQGMGKSVPEFVKTRRKADRDSWLAGQATAAIPEKQARRAREAAERRRRIQEDMNAQREKDRELNGGL